MNTIQPIYKKKGETPLEAIERFRDEQIIKGDQSFEEARLTYLGRLDPMAEGVLLVGINVNEEERNQYLHLDKEYIVDILFGIESDTWDALGIVKVDENLLNKTSYIIDQSVLQEVVEDFVGTHQLPYPLYSSKPISGTPLFSIARMGGSVEELPTRDMTFLSIEIVSTEKRAFLDIQKEVIEDIKKVSGDFRQQIITESWQTISIPSEQEMNMVRVKVKCTSGTYMRTLAHEIGRRLQTSAIACGIIRTKVGEFEIN